MSDNRDIYFHTFKITIPVLLGYLAIGLAFGLLLKSAGYPWYLAPFMSILVYAGAGQYVAVHFFVTNASLFELALTTFLVNSRHMVYGLSLIDKFKGTSGYKPYLIFSLTDETYALLTTVSVPDGMDKGKFQFLIALYDHIYWILGGVLGALIGEFIKFDTKGLDFALTALFVVLMIEQYKHIRKKFPFIIAFISGVFALIVFKENMLIAALLISIVSLFVISHLRLKGKDNV